jgi:hypothetical protein
MRGKSSKKVSAGQKPPVGAAIIIVRAEQKAPVAPPRLGAKIALITVNAGKKRPWRSGSNYTAACRENRPYHSERRTKSAQGALDMRARFPVFYSYAVQ